MNFVPQTFGIFANLYGSEDAMTISKSLLVALVGFITVVVLLAIIALFIKLIAFIFSLFTKKKPAEKPVTAPVQHAATKSATALRGDVRLVDVDEPTAAVIMALVSHNSGIPLERLDFKSIKLLEEK